MTFYQRRTFLAAALAFAVTAAKVAVADESTGAKMINERNRKLDLILAQAKPEIETHWEDCRNSGMEAMSKAATDAVDAEILLYFDHLKALGAHPSDEQILDEMKRLYGKLDEINASRNEGLLETDERELLVTVFVDAAVACGIDEAKYGGEPGGVYRNF